MPMKDLPDVMGSVLQHVEEMRQQRIQTMLSRVGSDEPQKLQQWIQEQGFGQTFAKFVPATMTTTQFACAFDLDYDPRIIQARLVQCADCPPHGGACDTEYDDQDRRGKCPTWNEDNTGFSWSDCGRWREYQIRRRLGFWGVPEKKRGNDLGNYLPTTESQADALEYCTQWAKAFKPGRAAGIFLYGPTRAGKTHLAIAILRWLYIAGSRPAYETPQGWVVPKSRVKSVQFWYVPDLIRKLAYEEKYEVRAELVDKLEQAELVIFDDLGAGKINEFEREVLATLIAMRESNNRAMIITSNIELGKLTEIGDRAQSRLAELHELKVTGRTEG